MSTSAASPTPGPGGPVPGASTGADRAAASSAAPAQGTASPERSGTAVRVRELHKSYGDLEVLRGIDLDVETGEVVCLIGPSGSGKSTLLRCLNLLETPQSGSITVDGL